MAKYCKFCMAEIKVLGNFLGFCVDAVHVGFYLRQKIDIRLTTFDYQVYLRVKIGVQ